MRELSSPTPRDIIAHEDCHIERSDALLFVLDACRAQLASQRDELRNLRNQASISAAISALVGTVFASLIGEENFSTNLDGGPIFGFSVPIVLVVANFFFSILFACKVVTGWSACWFDFDLDKLLVRIDKGTDEWAVRMVRQGEDYFGRNEECISNARRDLELSLAFSLFQFAAWILLLGGPS